MGGLLAPSQPGDFALTVLQPWADLIMAGVKTVENRGWAPPSTLPQWRDCESCDHRWRGNAHCPECGSYRWISVGVDGPFPFRLWIHAGKRVDSAAPSWALDWWLTECHEFVTYEQYALGALLGSVEVTGCHHAEDPCVEVRSHTDPSYRPRRYLCSRWAEPDCYHWTLADLQPLDAPIPMRGRQRLWKITADDLAVTADA